MSGTVIISFLFENMKIINYLHSKCTLITIAMYTVLHRVSTFHFSSLSVLPSFYCRPYRIIFKHPKIHPHLEVCRQCISAPFPSQPAFKPTLQSSGFLVFFSSSIFQKERKKEQITTTLSFNIF